MSARIEADPTAQRLDGLKARELPEANPLMQAPQRPPEPLVAGRELHHGVAQGRDPDDGMMRLRGVPDEECQRPTRGAALSARPRVPKVPPDLIEFEVGGSIAGAGLGHLQVGAAHAAEELRALRAGPRGDRAERVGEAPPVRDEVEDRLMTRAASGPLNLLDEPPDREATQLVRSPKEQTADARRPWSAPPRRRRGGGAQSLRRPPAPASRSA